MPFLQAKASVMIDMKMHLLKMLERPTKINYCGKRFYYKVDVNNL